MKMRVSLALVALLLAASGNVLADSQPADTLPADSQPAGSQDIAPEKRAQIEKLLEMTGAMKLTQQFSSAMVTQVTNALRSRHPDIPQKAFDILPEVVNGVISENVGTLKEMIIHIYDENFTLQDLKGLNQFYSSALGQKAVKVLPNVLAESFAAGQKWGQSLAPEMARRIQARFQQEHISL